MAVPATKRGRSASPDEFDDFDTSADDLIRAVDEAETKKARTDPAPGAAADGRALAPDTSPPAPSKPPSTASASETLSAQPGHAFSALGTDADPLLFERTTMDPAWFKLLEPSMRHASFLKLKQFLDAEKAAGKTIYPPPHLVYNWSRMTPLESVKVVIVGQDPYHQPGQACGLSFSVPRDKVIPPSLQNIYKELKNEFPGFVPPRHGCLDGWARQGVLLLNACSHHNRGWEPFTRAILSTVLQSASKGGGAKSSGPLAAMFAQQGSRRDTPKPGHKGIVFLAWGQPAARTLAEAGVTSTSSNVLLLKSPHPSPLSAHRGFLGNGHFAKANEWLEQPSHYGPGGGIRWDQV